jgi:hypothetical protein
VEQLDDYPHKDCEFNYWSAVDEKLREKAIYKDDERKRQDKVMDLRIDMAKHVLFDPYIARLPEPESATKTRKTAPKAARARSDVLMEATKAAAKSTKKQKTETIGTNSGIRMVFTAEEVKEEKNKHFVGTIHVYDSAPTELWTDTFKKQKGSKKEMVNKTSVFYSLLYEHAFLHVLKNAEWKTQLMEHGVRMEIQDNSSRLELKKAIEHYKQHSFEDQRESVLNSGDVGRLNDLNQYSLYRFVAEFLIQVPHDIPTMNPKPSSKPT